jgi:hypothetical protein
MLSNSIRATREGPKNEARGMCKFNGDDDDDDDDDDAKRVRVPVAKR